MTIGCYASICTPALPFLSISFTFSFPDKMPPDPQEKHLNTTPSSSDDSHSDAHLLRSTQDQVPVSSTSDDVLDLAILSMLKRNQRIDFTISKLCKYHEELLESHKL